MNTKRTIQQAAQQAGLSIDTLRYYERIGLISGVERNASGYRCYSDADMAWILFLKQLRATGIPIVQMLQSTRTQEVESVKNLRRLTGNLRPSSPDEICEEFDVLLWCA